MTASASDLLFRPRSVVVYGASSDPDKLSGRPLDYLKRFGFPGDLFAINRRHRAVQGVPAYPDIESVPGPVALAIVVVPAPSVAEALRRCAQAGVGAAIVFASGFAEIGVDGRVAQDEMVAQLQGSGMRLLGPNCLGSFAAEARTFATFSTAFDEEGERPDSPIALVSQSGAVGTFTYTSLTALGLGVRYFANTGNQSDITVAELLTELVTAPDVQLLLGHLEGVQDLAPVRELVAAAKENGKPLVLLKAGRTPAGSRAVAAHTASSPGDDEAFSRLLAEHGAVRVQSMEGLTDAALALSARRKAAGPRLTIVTQSGGAGAISCDAAEDYGLVVKPWQPEARARAAQELPYFGSAANPIDVTGAMINDLGMLARILTIVCETEETSAVLVVLGNDPRDSVRITAVVERAYAATDKPFVVAWVGGRGEPRRRLLAAGVPTYTDPHRAVRALSLLADYNADSVAAATAT